MAVTTQMDALRPILSHSPRLDPLDDADPLGLDDFEAEMKRLAVANDELLADLNGEEEEELELTRPTFAPLVKANEVLDLRRENAELKARIQELEAAGPVCESENVWLERQREYEMLLEEKSEVIRALHQKVQDLQESGGGPREGVAAGPAVGQAEEILRLKREMEDQRRQLEQDEVDMMAQLRQMELTMARERAEMARQRQEMSRLQADLAHEIEHTSRDAGLKERLHGLRRTPGGSMPSLPAPAAARREPAPEPEEDRANSSSSFLRRIFG